MGPVAVVAGQGAHLDPEIALKRAVTEAIQSRVIGLQGSREDLVRHASDYVADWGAAERKFKRLKERAAKGGNSRLPTGPDKAYASLTEMLEDLLARMKAAGYERVTFVDLTHPRLQVPVVRTTVVGLVDQIVDRVGTREGLMFTRNHIGRVARKSLLSTHYM